MAKRKKQEPEEFGLSEEVRRSIVAVVLIAVGAVGLLSVFGLAGAVGHKVDDILAMGLGLARVIVPALLILVGIGMVAERLNVLRPRVLTALIVFIISFSGLVNLFFASGIDDPAVLKNAGGALGLLFSSILVRYMGFGAALIIAIAVLIVAVLLILNKPIQVLMAMFKKEEGEEDGPKFVGDGIPEEEESNG